MRAYSLQHFAFDALKLETRDDPRPGPGQVCLDVKAISLNYRDLLVIQGLYNPKLALPVVPISDAAGVISDIGPDVSGLHIGDRVMTHMVVGWQDGPYRAEYPRTNLGTPGPGLAAERVVLPAEAVLPVPTAYSFEEAATLPIAALTAWSALVTVGQVQPGQTVLTLGTGGVSIFALQIAKALGARVIITSSSDEKLRRAAELGADHGVNYTTMPDWPARVLDWTRGAGVDVVVENGGAGTLAASMRACRAGGVIAMLGALTGLKAEVNLGTVLMKRLHIAGIMVDSKEAFTRLVEFLERHEIRPVIDRTFSFDELPAALRHMEAGRHFGKIVVQVCQ